MATTEHEISETFDIGGMSCAACAARIERVLRTTHGVRHADVNFATSRAIVRFDPGIVHLSALANRIEAVGFTARITAKIDMLEEVPPRSEVRVASVVTVIAIPVAFLGMSHGALPWISQTTSNHIQFILTTIIMGFAWLQFGTRAIRALMHLSTDMNTLVFLGVSAAYITSSISMFSPSGDHHANVYFEAVCVTTAFVLIGRAIESKARRATGRAVREILQSVPRAARRLGADHEIDAALLNIGDKIVVFKGERFPADCKVVDGLAIIDESALTGESQLREVAAGGLVSGGSVNHGDSVIAETTKPATESLLPRIAAAVERLQSGKAPISRLADVVGAKLTPIVILIASATFVVWRTVGGEDWQTAIGFAASVLVVACPCAVGLATPAAISAASGALAKRGLLFRDPASIEACAQIDAVVFDKTGTLTTGLPAVHDVMVIDHANEIQVLSILGVASRASIHPLACAYAASSKETAMRGEWIEIPGRGMEGLLDGNAVLFGSRSMLEERKVVVTETQHSGPQIHLAVSGRHIATVRFDETLRSDAKRSLATLRESGVCTHILSGDRSESVRAVADLLECPDWQGELSPAQKVESISQLKQNGKIAFVGDGINDAPALAAADLGISMHGSTGAALESAGLTITRPDLSLIPQAIEFSRRTVRTIRLNLLWAFGYNLIALPLAAGVLVPINGWKFNPMVASAAMALSSISVVLTSLRLRKM